LKTFKTLAKQVLSWTPQVFKHFTSIACLKTRAEAILQDNLNPERVLFF